MSSKATSIHLSIAKKGDPFAIVFKRQFFNAKECNVWLKANMEKYPAEDFRVTKEVY